MVSGMNDGEDFTLQYTKNQTTRKGDTTYYVCSEIKSGCKGRATVRTLSVEDENGQQCEAKQLVAVSTPQVS